MGQQQRKNRDRKARITVPTPEQIRAKREAAEMARLQREAHERERAKNPENWGPVNPEIREALANENAHRMAAPKRKSVYEKLLDDNIITQEQCRAGHKSVDIWARCNGLDGRHEKLMEFIDCNSGDASTMTDKRIDAQVRWKRMLNSVGKASGALLYALADCWILDGAEDWQSIVRRVYGRAKDQNADRDRKNLAMLIYSATENARLHFEEEEVRRREILQRSYADAPQ